MYPTSGPSPPTILVIEARVDVRTFIARTLRWVGYAVIAGGTVADARGAIDDYPGGIAVLIVELRLPDGGADDVMAAAPGVPAVIVTDWPDDCQHAPPGGVKILEKPFNATMLLSAVRAALAGLPGE